MLVVTNKRRTRGFQMRMASNRCQQFGIRQNAIGPSSGKAYGQGENAEVHGVVVGVQVSDSKCGTSKTKSGDLRPEASHNCEALAQKACSGLTQTGPKRTQ
ncbi:MAG: hypothetical protein NXY57DRAFT_1044206 [Lentinula lateritia]|nr:MAG: hypothetical protein NXY57DRAFT_1044206 [Lentinula lateritia]